MKTKRLTRGKAIKLYCKNQCCAGDTISWKDCTITDCFLWNFRMGKEMLEKEKTQKKNDSMLSKSNEKDAIKGGVENGSGN